jgi:hypothetical protein
MDTVTVYGMRASGNSFRAWLARVEEQPGFVAHRY